MKKYLNDCTTLEELAEYAAKNWENLNGKTNREIIIENLATLDDSIKLRFWNEWAEKTNSFDETIFCMEDFDELINPNGPDGKPLTPIDWAIKFHNAYTFDYSGERTTPEDFNPHHEFFMIDGAENLVSIPYVWSLYAWKYGKNNPIRLEEIADYLLSYIEESEKK